jgi:hypothetical protein
MLCSLPITSTIDTKSSGGKKNDIVDPLADSLRSNKKNHDPSVTHGYISSKIKNDLAQIA